MSLWQHRDFMKLWAGQTVSEIGSRITREGLPMGAVLVMSVTPLTMSGLSLMTQLPASLLGLFIGVWVDRLARRPLMIVADIVRALLLLTIPAAALLGALHLWLFFVVAGCTGILSLLFDVSYQAYLPWLVERKNLIEGNTKLGMTSSAAEVVGPGLTGILVQLLTAPYAIALDALSYLFSAFSLLRIGAREDGIGARQARVGVNDASAGVNQDAPGGHKADTENVDEDGTLELANWKQELSDGFRAIRSNRVLVALAGVAATFGFASSAMFVLDTLYALKTLGLSPLLFGLTVTMGGVGSLVGAALSSRVIRRFGVGRTLVVTLFFQGFAGVFWILAGGPVWRSVLCLLAAQLLGDTVGMIYGILDTTLRQTLTSDAMLGRVNATIRVLDIGFTALGSLVAGILGQTIGIRHTMMFAAAGMVLTTLWLVWSPARKLQSMPEIAQD